MTFNRVWVLAVLIGIAFGTAIGFYAAVAGGREGTEAGPAAQAVALNVPDGRGEEAVVLARAAPDDSRSESITVHGKWTLEVRDPDGTLVSTRVFQNSLSTFSGAQLLSSVLAGNITVMGWRIDIESFTSGQELCFFNSNPDSCHISAPADPRSGDQSFFPTLAVTGDSGYTGTGKLVLTGSITAQASGIIDRVGTRIRYGTGPEAYSFTVKSITPESVSAGQTVGATVEISFQ